MGVKSCNSILEGQTLSLLLLLLLLLVLLLLVVVVVVVVSIFDGKFEARKCWNVV